MCYRQIFSVTTDPKVSAYPKTKLNETKHIASQPLNLNPTTAKTQNSSMHAPDNYKYRFLGNTNFQGISKIVCTSILIK